MPRWVLLKHTLPDGTSHHDLMIERSETAVEPDSQHRLMSFRLPEGFTLGADASAERIPDHRVAYLSYEGPVSGGRGSVERVAAGPGRVVRDRPFEIIIELELGEGSVCYRAQPAGADEKWSMVAIEPGSW